MTDRILDRISRLENPTVVGLDPALPMIPGRIQREMTETYGKTTRAAAAMLTAFNREIIDSVADLVPAVKLQIAMYEQFGAEGIAAYTKTTAYAREKGLIVIGDIKRGDISSTARAYAAHLGGAQFEDVLLDPWQEDAVTLNPYLGEDSITPFLEPVNRLDKGLFILVKTSNPGSAQLQDLVLEKTGLRLYEQVADLVARWGAAAMGNQGYSRIGAVVGATHPKEGAALRKRMPRTFFLVPGYGAQGARGTDLRGFFDDDGRGCIVNSSRGIIAAWMKDSRFGEQHVGEAAREATLAMKADLVEAIYT